MGWCFEYSIGILGFFYAGEQLVTVPKISPGKKTMWHRFAAFLRQPWETKRRIIGSRWIQMIPRIPYPIRLSTGVWWLARNDVCSNAILQSSFEPAERAFVNWFLQPGMTVFDVGAHHGFYTLLASRLVGPHGRVIAFEPSRRERIHLQRHVKWNRCSNVVLESFALGPREGQADLYVVEGAETGCNSLRPPEVRDPTRIQRVHVTTLDGYVAEHRIERVDFLKLDAEGAELGILAGGKTLLDSPPRPVVLAEIQNSRTKPWGYQASEILDCLEQFGFRWFCLRENDCQESLGSLPEKPDGNFVAVPEERVESLLKHSPATSFTAMTEQYIWQPARPPKGI